MTIRYGYLQARVQARYAVLPDENIWRHIGALKSLTGFLEEARSTVLSHWVFGLTGSSSTDEIESQLKRQFTATVMETADWFDEQWQPAVRWLPTLLELPVLDYLIRSGKATEDAVTDPLLKQLLDNASDHSTILEAWFEKWHSQWPALSTLNIHGMELLFQLLKQHSNQFPLLPVDQTWQARIELQLSLKLLFRRQLLQPSMGIIYLCLVALSLERLRAELLRRALFPYREAAI